MAHPPDDAVRKQAGQCAVNRRVSLAKNARQFCRVDERHPVGLGTGVEAVRAGEAGVSVGVDAVRSGPVQQKGRSPRSESSKFNWSSRLLGTHPLKELPPRRSDLRLERLPSSAGISPLKPLPPRRSHIR